MKRLILLLSGLLSFSNIFCQSEDKIVPFLKTGAGYFNDQLMISGTILSSEAGIKLNNGYLFSIQYSSGETFNDKASFSELEFIDLNFIYTYKIFTLNLGYNFTTKNKHHSFIPMMGPFYSINQILYPNITTYGMLELIKINQESIGISLTFQYLYNFKNGISIGISASGNYAYQLGPLYYYLAPVVSFTLE